MIPCHQVWCCPYGNANLATAGSGDVLSGIMGAFVSQFDDFRSAVEAAVLVHGLSGEISDAGIFGTVADDLNVTIPLVIKEISPFG